MKLVCPHCNKEYTINKNTPGIERNISGEYFYVCHETTDFVVHRSPYFKKQCGGYMVVDIDKLNNEVTDEEIKKNK